MTILMAILTALCVFFLSRWLLGQRPGATEHVQLLPDGSVPDMDRPAPRAQAEPVSEPVAVADDAPASKGTGTDAADVVRSGSRVPPDSDTPAGDTDDETPDVGDANDTTAADTTEADGADDADDTEADATGAAEGNEPEAAVADAADADGTTDADEADVTESADADDTTEVEEADEADEVTTAESTDDAGERTA